jgi:transposase
VPLSRYLIDNNIAELLEGAGRELVIHTIVTGGGSVIDLPPYSPDLNPIEQLFAKLKALLRKAAARTRDELWDIVGTLLGAFTPAECRNYLENAGYAFT